MARKTPRQHAAEFVNSCTPWQLLYPQRRKGSGGGRGNSEELQRGTVGAGCPGTSAQPRVCLEVTFIWDVWVWDCRPWDQRSLGGMWLGGARTTWVWVPAFCPLSLKQAHFFIRQVGRGHPRFGSWEA